MPERAFYVGYASHAPASLARRLRLVVAGLIVAGLAVAGLLVAAQSPFAPAVFEVGVVRTFSGVLEANPHPILHVYRPGAADDAPAVSSYPLSVFGKSGAGAAVAGMEGRTVELQGSLVYREGRTMIEIVDGSVRPADPAVGAGDGGVPVVALGRHTFVGEIVDSKCHLGVMNPGQSKPHRSCAARCISGGVPPILVSRDADGRPLQMLLVGAGGESVNRRVLPMVAEPVEIQGELERRGDLLVLKADPDGYRRVSR